MVIGLFTAFGQDLDLAASDGVQRRANDFLCIDKPLVGQHRFDDDFGTITKGLHDRLVFNHWNGGCHLIAVLIRRNLCGHNGQAFVGDLLNHQLAGLKTIQAAQIIWHQVDRVDFVLRKVSTLRMGLRFGGFLAISRAIGPHAPARVHQAIHWDAAAFGDLIVIEIMRAGDFHGT